MARKRISRDEIVSLAATIVADRGTEALTYQVLADGLGVSKQAIIYWFPSKSELARELILPALRGESDTAIAAVEGSESPADAIDRFVRALTGYHLGNIGRFRMLYLSGRPVDTAGEAMVTGAALDEIHAITTPMYAALAAALARGDYVLSPATARQQSAIIHMAAIGLLTMLALADAINDPLAHATEPLIETMIGVLTAGAATAAR